MATIPKYTARGFTIIEAVVIVTILVLLAGVLIPIVSSELSSARGLRAQTDMKIVAEAFNRYFAHTATWPSNFAWDPNQTRAEPLQGLPCLYTNVYDRAGWAGPYMSTGVKEAQSTWSIATSAKQANQGTIDPWGNCYRVYYFARNGAMGPAGGIVLLSAGENGSVDTSAEQLLNGESAGDDLVQVVTRRL
jgi:type II secretory pathway pseudopilin PulG